MPKRRDTLCAKNILLLFLLFEIRQSINFAPPSLFILFINNVLKEIKDTDDKSMSGTNIKSKVKKTISKNKTLEI